MNATLLLVEDDATDVLFMRKALARVSPGIPLEVARDGDEALEILARMRPTHVLLDLKLPKRSGLEVLQWIQEREEAARLRIVVLTSSSEKLDIDRARGLGVDDYLTKPVGFPELVELLRQLLRAWGLAPSEGPAPTSGSPPGPARSARTSGSS